MSSEAKDNPFHQQILDDDTAFVTAVQMYKNIVTHYLASKFEIWMNLFMKPIYGFKGGNCSKEFAQSRGVIHYHVAGQSDHPVIKNSQEYIRLCAEAIADEMETVNQFIEEHYNPQLHGRIRELPKKEGGDQEMLVILSDPSVNENLTKLLLARDENLDRSQYPETYGYRFHVTDPEVDIDSYNEGI
jgi:hypothetical protein